MNKVYFLKVQMWRFFIFSVYFSKNIETKDKEQNTPNLNVPINVNLYYVIISLFYFERQPF